MITEFALTLPYTQVVVHLPELDRPGVLWTGEHVDQGFAWSDGIVAFGVPDHDGACLIRVDASDDVGPSPDALWAVQTPFTVADGPLKVGTIANMRDVSVPAGQYDLVFEARPGTAAAHDGPFAFVLTLNFNRSEAPDFAILKQGEELASETVLRQDADRA